MKNIFLIFILLVTKAFWQTKIDTSFNGIRTDYYANGNIKCKAEYKKGRANGAHIM